VGFIDKIIERKETEETNKIREKQTGKNKLFCRKTWSGKV
jgi:hypothetical protein